MALLPCKAIITLTEESNNGMNKDILDIIRYSARCEAAVNALIVLKEDYKRQGKRDLPISTIEMIISTIDEG